MEFTILDEFGFREAFQLNIKSNSNLEIDPILVGQLENGES